jgi:hypothetical protein
VDALVKWQSESEHLTPAGLMGGHFKGHPWTGQPDYVNSTHEWTTWTRADSHNTIKVRFESLPYD